MYDFGMLKRKIIHDYYTHSRLKVLLTDGLTSASHSFRLLATTQTKRRRDFEQEIILKLDRILNALH